MKPKMTQPKKGIQIRDKFFTPRYAVDLVAPYLKGVIWEPAAGSGMMVRAFEENGFVCHGTELEFGADFLKYSPWFEFDTIATNPPFSLKEEFYNTCKKHNVPFALLLPVDFCGWILRAMKEDGAKWIIPTRRIDYITPDVLNRVHEGEVWRIIKKGKEKTLKAFKENHPKLFDEYLDLYKDVHNYDHVEEIPVDILLRYSAAQFHSGWFCVGLDLPEQVTVVELTKEQKTLIWN